MTHYQYAATILWIKIIKPIWSFIINGVFWVGHLNKIKQTRQEMVALSKLKLQTIMSIFRWREDNLKDWTPWIMTIVYNGLQDDCDGAAVLAMWRLRQDGVKARIVHLYSNLEGHAVCVADDNRYFVSNNLLFYFSSPDWRTELLNHYNGKYNTVID